MTGVNVCKNTCNVSYLKIKILFAKNCLLLAGCFSVEIGNLLENPHLRILHRLEEILRCLPETEKCEKVVKGRGGDQVVNVLAYYSDDPSSNPSVSSSFFIKIVV